MTFIYIGLVIGAGFASGREIFEFFNLYTRNNILGILFAGVLFSFLIYAILYSSNKEGLYDFFEYVDIVSGKGAKLIKIFMLLYMFTGFFVMISAGGTLISSNLLCDKKLGIFVITVICLLVLMFETKGVVVLNFILVPIMIIGIVYICISSFFLNEVETFLEFENLKKNYIISAICYVSYNTINAGAVLVPSSNELTREQIKRCAVLSGGILTTLILLIWLAQNLFFNKIYYSDFPMVDIASFQGIVQKNIYTLVLFMSILTTAVSCGYGILSNLKIKRKKERVFLAILLCLFAAPLSCLGFSYLISNFYTFFGFMGIIWLLIIIRHFII